MHYSKDIIFIILSNDYIVGKHCYQMLIIVNIFVGVVVVVVVVVVLSFRLLVHIYKDNLICISYIQMLCEKLAL